MLSSEFNPQIHLNVLIVLATNVTVDLFAVHRFVKEREHVLSFILQSLGALLDSRKINAGPAPCG